MTTPRKIVELDEGLEFIEKAIEKLMCKLEGYPDADITVADEISIYTKVYDMYMQPPPHKYSKELYDKYKEWIVEYITSTVLPSLREKHDEPMLRELVERWAFHKNLVKRLSRYFEILDRYYVPMSSLQPLNKAGLNCFRDLVLEEFKGEAMDTMICLIARDREGKPIDRALLKRVLDVFFQLGIDFEEAVLKETASYYSNRASSLIHECSNWDYMLKAEECLALEKNRACHYLHASSEAAILEVVRHEFQSVYTDHHLEKEKSRFLALLRDENVKELSRMFKPFSKGSIWCHVADPLANIFKQHVHTGAIAIVSKARDAARLGQEFVPEVIELHEKCLTYVNECFMGHDLFHQAMTDVFKWLCNTDAVRARQTTELLASFWDDILKAGCSKQSSTIEESLGKASKLLPYVSDKDHFVELYREKLAGRLLSGRANNDRERNILTKLKRQLGDWFQSTMERMVEDIASTKGHQVSFREYIRNKGIARPRIDLAVTVLTTGIWQNFKSMELNLPPEMAKSVEVYEGYYRSKMRNRKLAWIHMAGTCDVIGRFGPKTMELIVTPAQAATLLLFNSADRLSYSAIKKQLNLTDDEDAVGILRSLSCDAKHKVLNKVPASETISWTNYFEFNTKFTDKMKIRTEDYGRIPPPPVVFDRENKKAIKGVNNDQRYAIDASIVRVMKRRKVLSQRKLVEECVEQLGRVFKPDIRKVIKERIEALMARDYLERDRVNPNLLRYVP